MSLAPSNNNNPIANIPLGPLETIVGQYPILFLGGGAASILLSATKAKGIMSNIGFVAGMALMILGGIGYLKTGSLFAANHAYPSYYGYYY